MRKRIYEKPVSTTIDIETAPLMASQEYDSTEIKAYNDYVPLSDDDENGYGVQF